MAGDNVVLFLGFSKDFISSIWDEVHRIDELFEPFVEGLSESRFVHKCGKRDCLIQFTRISVTPLLKKHYLSIELLFYGTVCKKEFSVVVKQYKLPKKDFSKLKSVSELPSKLYFTPESLLKKLNK